MSPRVLFSLVLSGAVLAACGSSSSSSSEPIASLPLPLEGGGGAGGSPCDPPVDCVHAIDAETFCVSCPEDGGPCPEGDTLPREHVGGSCVPFLGPGGTAIDESCAPGLWCSRCSGECAERPRDCGC